MKFIDSCGLNWIFRKKNFVETVTGYILSVLFSQFFYLTKLIYLVKVYSAPTRSAIFPMKLIRWLYVSYSWLIFTCDCDA